MRLTTAAFPEGTARQYDYSKVMRLTTTALGIMRPAENMRAIQGIGAAGRIGARQVTGSIRGIGATGIQGILVPHEQLVDASLEVVAGELRTGSSPTLSIFRLAKVLSMIRLGLILRQTRLISAAWRY